MVRQRLAQIERNHSHISAQSGVSTRPSTPISSLGGSGPGWSRSAISSPTPKCLSTISSHAAMQPTRRRNTHRLKECVASPQDDESRKDKQREKADDILQLAKGIADIKGVLGGESGSATLHQVVVGFDHRVREDEKTLKKIHTKVDQLGERFENATSASSAARLGTDPLKEERVLRAVEEIKTRLDDLSTLAAKIQEIRAAQLQKVACNDVGTANDSKSLDLKPILDKLEGIQDLLEAEKNGGVEVDLGTQEVR